MDILVIGCEPSMLDVLMSHEALEEHAVVVGASGLDPSTDRPIFVSDKINVFPLIDGEPIAWERGDVRALLSGPYARPGWVSRCIDPSTGLWETYRLTRRAARRARGRARAAARRLREMGPS